MRRTPKILTFYILLQLGFANCSFGNKTYYHSNIIDTTKLENESQEVKAIDEVIKSPAPPNADKVRYFSKVTKYGFKDLFKNYSYNPAIPYSSQVNPYAETFMQDYLQAHGKSLERMKATAVPYFNLIDGILAKYGLPKELKYLAVIESDLKSDALSIAGACGPWQFMISTAKNYGLKVNQNEDDRTDYYKSTNAAAKYLLDLYKDFNDWLLVIAAYNGGPGRVYSAIKKCGSRNFWKLQYYLPEESRNHVKKFIATHYIMESGVADGGFDYVKLNTDSGTIAKPAISDSEATNSKELAVSGRFNAEIIATNIGMDITDFNRYNPGFDNMLSSAGTYNLRLPEDKMQLFIADKYPILNQCVQQLLGEANVDSRAMPEKSNQKSKGK